MTNENRSWRRYFRFWGPDPEKEVGEEFRFHLEAEIEEFVSRGMSLADARARALAQFGDVSQSLAECRAADDRRLRRVRRAHLLDLARHDARFALRGLTSRPAFTFAVVVTLALGVGANAAVFSIVDRVFLRPPPGVESPSELRRLYTVSRQGRDVAAEISLPQAREIESAVGAVLPATIYLHEPRKLVRIGSDRDRLVGVAWVTPSFFPVLGVRPGPGREFRDDELRFGEPPAAAIISSAFWRRELGADANAIGQVIRIDGHQVTIVGVAPRDFGGIDVGGTDLWLPLSGYGGIVDGTERWYENRGWSKWNVVARVPAGTSDQQLAVRAQEALRAGMRSYRIAFPKEEQFGDTGVRVTTGSIIAARGPTELSHEMSIAVVLAGVALLVLIIASANASNLLLGRALQRRRETALRLALGITPRRLVGQILLEAVMLALVAAVAATLVALWVGEMLRGILLPGVDWYGPAVDPRVALFGMAIAIVGAVAAGLVAAQQSLRVDAGVALQSGGRDGGGRKSLTRATLVGVQAALSLVLLVGTGLFARTLYNIQRIDLGHDVPRLITVQARDASTAAKLPALADLARSLPGVSGVAATSEAPFTGRTGVGRLFTRAGDTIKVLPRAETLPVEAGYLTTVGTRIIRGRDLSAADALGGPRMMVISEEIERRLWPSGNALGECLRLNKADAPCHTIIGVAENANGWTIIEKPNTVMYVTLRRPAEAWALVVRTSSDPTPVVERLRAELGDTIPGATDHVVELLAETLAPQYRPWQLGAKLFTGFATLAVVLAGLGLYSVLAYLVTLRHHEFGIRLALGATGANVVRLVITDGVRHVAAGIIGGLVIVFFGSRFLVPLLYDVSPRDPVVLGAAVLVLLLGAIVAALFPARRAVRVDPLVALRSE